jgi:hypothetical protein
MSGFFCTEKTFFRDASIRHDEGGSHHKVTGR